MLKVYILQIRALYGRRPLLECTHVSITNLYLQKDRSDNNNNNNKEFILTKNTCHVCF